MEKDYDLVLNGLDAFTAGDFGGHETERLKLVASARKLISRLETNEERFYTVAFQEPIVYAVLKTCIDLGLWRGWTAAGGGEKSFEQLAAFTTKDCDPNLFRRLVRLMGAANIIEETGEDRYKPTAFSLSIGDRNILIEQAVISRAYHWEDSIMNVPPFLAKTSYREPRDPKITIYSDADPDGLPFFDRCMASQMHQDTFSGFMREWSKYKIPWPEFYDTASLIDGADLSSGTPLIVDLGGHHGYDLLTLLRKHPDLPAGSLILQDLPGVISDVVLDTDKIKPMAHSFFEAQPVHGSRAYFFHAVFHDWADEVAVQIMKNIVPAMKKGYSKLLICDIMIPSKGASLIQTVMDLNMMAFLSGCERTEATWTKLINEAGLKIVKIWMDPRRYEAMIEAELA
ncbi:putative O-methyltransferase [Hypoxylon crocopeplum]|nr:putative O-methyltransferase [Hypoxylon crocopeplum]